MKQKLLIAIMALSFPLAAFSADGDIFTADVGGVEMEFKVLSEADKTCQVGRGLTSKPCISKDYVGSIVIPSTVNGYSVTSIGTYAFSWCSGLTSITIPNSVTSIGQYAFYECSGLTSLTIPNSVTSIGTSAFSCCSGLTSINIPNSVTSIAGGAFYGCDGLTSITIPNSVTSIGWCAFQGCSRLQQITVNTNNPVYDSREGCNAIIETSTNTLITGCKNTVIPNSVTSIGQSAFSECSSLTSINIPNSVTSIGDYAFAYCRGLTSVTIPNSVTSIGQSAFSDCSSLTSINIPNSVTTIGGYAFYNCTGLTSVTIPNSIISIEVYAFYNCTGLTSVTIPNNVTSIGRSAFSGCTSLKSVTFEDGSETLSFENDLSAPVFYSCPIETLYLGRTLAYKDNYSPFYQCTSLKSLSISNSVTSIGQCAFYECSGLTSVTIPNSVTSIGNFAFYYCRGLTSVTIPNSVTSIGPAAFRACSGLTSVTIGNSVTTIGHEAFYWCKNLKDVHISDLEAWCNIQFEKNDSYSGPEKYSSNPLLYAQHLYLNETDLTESKELVIPNTVTAIGAFAFGRCHLTSVTIPNSVTSIGEYAFEGCSGLTSIIIPNSVTTIGNSAFYNSRLEYILTKNATTDFTGAFSDRTYRHAMLYIPIGTWSDAVYVSGWYRFYNMRETAMTTDALAPQQAYSLVDAETYDYMTYDQVNDDVASGTKFYNLDESNPDNAWQVIESAGMKYLYNIGAKRYATFNVDGTLELSVNAQPVEMENTEEGILLSKKNGKKYLFVTNENVQTESIPTNIGAIQTEEGTRTIYDLTGRKTNSMQPGINLLRMNDGSVKKIFVK